MKEDKIIKQMEKLELKCFRGTATEEDFEKAIKKAGLLYPIICMIAEYYAEDLKTAKIKGFLKWL